MPASLRSMAALLACASASFAFWVSGGALAVTAGPASPRVALLPPWWLLALVLIAAAGAIVAWRPRAETTLPLWGALILLLPWLPFAVPASMLLWIGPARVWLCLAIVFAVLAAARPSLAAEMPSWFTDRRRAPFAAAAIAFALFAAAYGSLSSRLPGGDEPHYLIITQSLLRDGDLQIENNHRRGDYRAYFSGVLRPDYLRRGVNGQIYSIHAPGLPAVVAPAFALGGYHGVVVFLMLLAALTSAMTWTLGYRLTSSAGASWFGWAAACLTTPFLFHAFTVYPDPVGAAVVVLTLLLITTPRPTVEPSPSQSGPSGPGMWRLAPLGAAIALLPWLHSRYAVLAVTLGLVVLLRIWAGPRSARMRHAFAFLAVPILSAAAWFLFFYALYGTPNPAAPYGGYTQAGLDEMPRGLTGLLIDQQFGLLPNAPVLAFAFVGFVALARRSRRLAIELAAIAVPYTLVAASYHMWWAGASSPARFLVAIVPALAMPAAAFFASASTRLRWVAVGALAVSLAIVMTLAFVNDGAMLYQDRTGVSLWLQWAAPLVDAPHGVPSLFRGTVAQAWRDAAVWIVCLVAALFVAARIDTRRGRATGALAAVVALPLAAMLALTIVWRFWNVEPIAPAGAQLRLLSAYPTSGAGVLYRPFRRASRDDIVEAVRIGWSKASANAAPPVIALANVPAGRYAIAVERAPNAARQPIAMTLEAARTIVDRWTVEPADAPEEDPGEHALRLPVAVPRLVVRSAADTHGRVAAWLRMVAPAPTDDPLARLTARAAARYGSAMVFYVDGRAYLEPSGVWVSPGAVTRLVITDPGSSSVRLMVGSGPNVNECSFSAGKWEQRVTIEPGTQREVMVPVPLDGGGVLVSVGSSGGFVPADVEPGNGDRRLLGCRLEFPGQD